MKSCLLIRKRITNDLAFDKINITTSSINRLLQRRPTLSSFAFENIDPTTNISCGKFLSIPKIHRKYLSTQAQAQPQTVPIIYVNPEGEEQEVQAEIGMNLLDVAHANNIELEGACGGELACATCHLIFEKQIYDTLPEKEDEEDDMLDLAFHLTDTSRLGCQICTTEQFSGMKVIIPADDY